MDELSDEEAALMANPERLEQLKRGIAQAKAGEYEVFDTEEDDDA